MDGGIQVRNVTFGQLLEKLLYLSNQKKSMLAKALGYDDSYISKWINGKNLPTQKNILNICRVTSEFIVNSLNSTSVQDVLDYFEISDNIENDKILVQYIEGYLKDAYMQTSQKSLPNVYKNTHWEDSYNGMIHINPRLRKQYLAKDLESHIIKASNLDLIICANLSNLNISDKMSIANMKHELSKIENQNILQLRLLVGFKSNEDVIFNTTLLMNLITLYPDIKFDVYNCNISSDNIIAVVKNKIFHCAIFSGDGECLFTTMSREKRIVDDMYYNMEEIQKKQGKFLVTDKSSIELIKDKIYTQYIMGRDLRCLIGCMNEIFIPLEVFDEICKALFYDEAEIVDELNNINVFLQKVTYKSKLKVLIYESELRKYISSGELRFFNNKITLSFEQREKHLKYIEKIILEDNNVEIRLISGDFIDSFKDNKKASMYLSKTLKMLQTNSDSINGSFKIIKDNEFANLCDNYFDSIWDFGNDIIISDKDEILERINKAIIYSKIVNGNYNK